MATIRQDNIIVSLDFQNAKAKAEIKEIRDDLTAIEDAGPDLRDALIEAFELDIVNKYTEAIAATGVEIEDTEELAKGLQEGLREAFDTTDPDEYLASLQNLSEQLDKVDVSELNDSLQDLDKNNKKNEQSSKSFFGKLPGLAKAGLAATATAVAAGAAAIAAALVVVGGAIAGGVVALFNRATDRVPSVKKNFEDLQKELRKIGDYLAAQLAPVFNKLIDIVQKFIESVDLTKVLDAFNSLFIVVEDLVSSFLSLFGIDFESFGESAGGVVNFISDLFTSFSRNFVGFSRAVTQIFRNIQVAAIDFLTGTLQAIDFALPGKQFENTIASLQKSANRVRDELYPSIGAAFQSGIDDFDAKLKDAQKDYEDFDLFRGFDDDAEKVEKTLQAVVGSLQFYRDQINALKADADLVAPEIAARLLDQAADLERRLELAELEVQQRLDNIRGLLTAPFQFGPELTTDQTFEDVIESQALEQAQKYADALIAASKEVANKEIAPELINLAQEVQRQINEGDLVITPTFSSTLEGVKSQYEDTLEVISSLNDVYERSAERRAARAKAQQEQIKQTLDDVAEVVGGVQSAFDSVAGAFASQIDLQIQKLDELVEAQQARIDKALQLAEFGNAEIVQLEEQRLEKILEARQNAIERERALAGIQLAVNQGIAISQGIVAITKAFAEGNVVSGIAAGVALAGSLAAIVITLNDTFSGIPTFFEGVEHVPGHPRTLSIIGVHGQERIFNHEANKRIDPKHSNERVVELYNIGRIVEENPARAIVMAENGRIAADSIPTADDYDYSRLEALLSENTGEIKRMNKKLERLRFNVNVDPKKINKANKDVERINGHRKNLMK